MSMARYVGRRVIEIVITLFIITTLLFFLFRIMPGDPSSLIINPQMSAQTKAMIRAQYGLDQPLMIQYGKYIVNMFHGDFGESFNYREPVFDVIKRVLPNTILLFTLATFTSYAVGITIGRIIAWKRRTKWEYGATIFGLSFYNMPIFWFGFIMLFIFSYKLELFPLGQMRSPELWIDPTSTFFDKALDVIWHLILPLTTLTIWLFAGSMLLMRNSMLETLNDDYITTAKAKGLPDKVIRDKHASRNAMLPVVTAFGLSLAFSVSGGVLTETVFSWPGIGYEIVRATINYDYPLVQACFFILASLVLTMMLVVDILYAYLDPRIKY